MRSATAIGAGWFGRRRFLFLLSMAALIRPAKAESVAVEIRQFKFAPAEIEIKPGTTVTFTNADLVPHTATGEGFDTGVLKSGESRQITFSEAGDFPYLCTFHRHMKGLVRVR